MFAPAGKLRFLADRTQPQILVAAGHMSTGAHNPSPFHVRGYKHILQYLDSHHDEGVCLGGVGEIKLFGFSDAAHFSGGESKSTIGFCFYLNLISGTILARSKRSSTVDLSSTEEELKALAEATRQSVLLRELLEEVGHQQLAPTVIYTDSASAQAMVDHRSSTQRANHLTKFFNYVKQEVEISNVELRHIPGQDNVADLLTKALAAEAHSNLSHKLQYGLDGIPPDLHSISTPHQRRLRSLAKIRAANRNLTQSTRITVANYVQASMMTIPDPNHESVFKLWHPATNHTIFQGYLEKDNTCHHCALPTCVGFEMCNQCLQQHHKLSVRSCHIGTPPRRETGLFADNGQPIFRTNASKQSPNEIIFEAGQEIFEYNGEILGSIIPDSSPKHYDGVAKMHDRYEKLPGPYCLELPNGQVIDAALRRGIASLANHGPMNGVIGIIANAELHYNQTNNRAWIQAIRPIRNGDRILINYARNTKIAWMAENGYKHFTN